MFQLDKKHQKYEKYNPTNIDWIGDIPNGWEVWKLKRLGNIETGTTPPKAEEGNYMEDGIPWIKPDNLDGFVPLNDSKEKLSPMGASQARIIKKGSVLVCGIGTIGKIGVAGCDLTTNQQINSITFYQKIDELFGQYLVFASRKEMEKQSNKVVVSILNKSQQSNIFYPVCSLQEQHKIATYLDEKTTILNEAIAKKKKQIELLGEHRTALINDAITKGLDKNVEMKNSGIEWIGEIPKGWEVWKLKRLGNIETGTTPPKAEEGNYMEDGIPWIKPDNLDGFVPLNDSKEKLSQMGASQARIIKKGSVLVCGIGTIGKIGVAGCDLTTNQQINSITFNQKIDELFGQYLIFASRKEMEKQSNKVVVSILNKSQQSNIFYPVYSLQEQQKITTYLDKETKYIDDMIAKIEKSIELLEEYKTSLISHIVSGKIRVS